MPSENKVSVGVGPTEPMEPPLSNPDREDPSLEASKKYSSLASLYLKHATDFDKNMVFEWNSGMDILLLFAALFSAIVTAFMIMSISDLKEDYLQANNQLLRILVAKSLGHNITAELPPPFQPQKSAVVVNSLWTTSLVTSLGSALGGILCKQFLREYMTHLSPTPTIEKRMLQRHSRFRAFQRWHVPLYIAFLPVILHMAALLFLAGLVLYLQDINTTVKNVALATVGIICFAYLAFMCLPLFTTAPFGTPVTAILTQLMSGLMRYTLQFIYAVYLFVITVVKPAAQEHEVAKKFEDWIVVVRHSSRLVVQGAITALSNLEQTRIDEREGDNHHVEISSWLIPHLLEHNDMKQVVELLSEVRSLESQRILADNGIDIVLLNHLEYSCFHKIGPGASTKLIPERIPFALSCLDVLSAIASSTSTTVQNAAWMGLPTDKIINSLLGATNGRDRLRVLAASVWLVNDNKKSMVYRRSIEQHLMGHINHTNKEEMLEDQIVKVLVDALHPSLGIISADDVTRLLRNYLNDGALPSADCLHSILFNLWNRDSMSGDNPEHRHRTSMHFIAHLLERNEKDRPLYLDLIQKLPQVIGHESIADADLSECLFRLLEPATEESLIIDVLRTIERSPTSCHGHHDALRRLAKVYKKQPETSKNISQAAIKAIASFMISMFRGRHAQFESMEFTFAKQVQDTVKIITKNLLQSTASFGDPIAKCSIYILCMACSHIDTAFSKFKPAETEMLLNKLMNQFRQHNNERGISLSFCHALQVILGIMKTGGISAAEILADSKWTTVWKNLTTSDDSRIRWFSFEILMFVSSRLLLHMQERERMSDIFKFVKDDIERRLHSDNPTAFIDLCWEDLTDAPNLTTSRSALPRNTPQAVNPDIEAIKSLLKGAPSARICKTTVFVTDDFPWSSDFACLTDSQ